MLMVEDEIVVKAVERPKGAKVSIALIADDPDFCPP
jgi:hypothetical protein